MKRLRFLISYGPTQEPIDPVRYISNCSTGVMGRALVQAARRMGHRVDFVECPTQARTALELQKILHQYLPKADVLIMAAAVCDVRPRHILSRKIKKEQLNMLMLEKNPDILASLGRKKSRNQIFIGFGIESTDMIQKGLEKLSKKRLEMIVMQEVTKNKCPFGDIKVTGYLLKKNQPVVIAKNVNKCSLAHLVIAESEKLHDERVKNKKRD